LEGNRALTRERIDVTRKLIVTGGAARMWPTF
jgi:hypothetical protein